MRTSFCQQDLPSEAADRTDAGAAAGVVFALLAAEGDDVGDPEPGDFEVVVVVESLGDGEEVVGVVGAEEEDTFSAAKAAASFASFSFLILLALWYGVSSSLFHRLTSRGRRCKTSM